jgi:signal transduction histidine kinase
LVSDTLVAIVVTAIALGGSIAEAHPKLGGPHTGSAQLVREITSHQPGAAYALVVVGGLALFWRRRYPLAVLAVTVATTAAYGGAGYVPGAALSSVFVALYTVGVYQPRRVAVEAGAVAAAVLFVADGWGGPFGWIGGTNAVMLAFAVAAVALGIAVAGKRQVMVVLVERAERAERDREEEARRRVDAERLRIARELHDVVAHTMSMINIQASVAVHVMGDHPDQAAEALGAIKSASREGLRELRAILNVLRQVDEEDGTAPAPRLAQLEALADATTQAGLPTSVTVSGARPDALPETVELAAYRIVQESLTNVLRHAGPDARATVSVTFEPGRVVVQVDDDGQTVGAGAGPGAGAGAGAGLGPLAGVVAPGGGARGGTNGGGTSSVRGRSGGRPATAPGSGSGIAGMRERAAAFGGTIEAGPRPDGGWRVRAVLPEPESRP